MPGQPVNPALQNLQELQATSGGIGGPLGLLINPVTRGRRERKGKAAAKAVSDVRTEEAQNLISGAFGGQDPTAFDFGVNPLELAAEQRLLENPNTRPQGEALLSQTAAKAGFAPPLGALDEARLANAQQQLTNFQQQQQINTENINQERIQSQIAQMDLQKRLGGIPDPANVMDTAIRFGAARDAQLKPYQRSVDAFNRVRELGVAGMSPANATSLLFQFVQTQDNTAVRDGERAMVTSQSGPLGELVNKINLYAQQGAFTAEAWDDIIQSTAVLAKSQYDTMDGINDRWDKRMGVYAQEYMMPALVELTQSTLFDPDQTFGFEPTGEGKFNFDPGQDNTAQSEQDRINAGIVIDQ